MDINNRIAIVAGPYSKVSELAPGFNAVFQGHDVRDGI